MAAGTGESLGVERLLSFAEDLVGTLRVSTDREDIVQVGAGVRGLQSVCQSETDDLEMQIKDYQESIRLCKEELDKEKLETIADDELNALQGKMEEKLQEETQLRQELRVLHDELDDQDRQRVSIKERGDAVKKKKKDWPKKRHMIAMYAHATDIVPIFQYQDKISGYFIDQNRKKILEKFKFENTTPSVDICNELWKKV